MEFIIELLKEPFVVIAVVAHLVGFSVIVWLFLRNHPPPVGSECTAEFRKIVLEVERGNRFAAKLKWWYFFCRCWRHRLDREQFRDLLSRSKIHEFETGAWCMGWAGPVPEIPEKMNPEYPGQWLFGFSPWVQRRVRIRESAISHELMHAAQDLDWKGYFFRPLIPRPWYATVFIKGLAEFEALLIGSPMILFSVLGMVSPFPILVILFLYVSA